MSPRRSGRRPRTRRSVQEQYVLPREILAGNMVSCAAPAAACGRRFLAIARVEGLNFALKGAQEQARLITAFRQLVYTLTWELQILLRTVPLDLAPYHATFLADVPASPSEHAQEAPLSGPLSPATQDASATLRAAHLAHLAELAQGHVLLDRQCYLIIPADLQVTPSPVRWPGRPRARQRAQGLTEAFLQAQEQVALRLRELTRLCAAMGIPLQRVEGTDLARLLASCQMQRRPSLPQSLLPSLADPEQLPLERCEPVTEPLAEERAPQSPRVSRWRRLRQGRRAPTPGPSPQLPSPATVQLADLLAPAGVTLEAGTLVLHDLQREYVRTLVVQEVARDAQPGWLRPLLELDEPDLEISLHLHPQSSAQSLRFLRRKATSHQASRLVAARRGTLLDAHTQVAGDDVSALLLKVASGDERLAEVTMSVLVRAASRQALERRSQRVQAVLGTMTVCRPAFLLQDDGYRSSLPLAQDQLQRWGYGLLLDATSISTFFPFMTTHCFLPTGILYGVTAQGDPLVIDRWHARFQNANCLVDGPSGYGKSFFLKLLILRLLIQHQRRQVIITDPDREYKRLCQHLGGQWVRLAAGSPYRINPLDLSYGPAPARPPTEEDDDVYLEDGDRLAEKVTMVLALLQIMLARRGPDGVVPLLPEEIGYLEQVLYEAYRRVGITSKSTTAGRQAPLLRDVAEIIEKGVFGPDRFALGQRLYPYVSGSYASFFDGPTNVRLDSRLLVFDTRDLDAKLAPVILALLSDFVWTQTFESSMPREFIIDEAGVLAEYDAWAQFMAHIVARARKHWLAVTLILQNIESLQQSRYARMILDNCDLKVLLGRTRTTTLRESYDLSEREEELLHTLPRGEGLLLLPTQRVAARFVANPLEYALATTNPVDLARLRAQAQAAEANPEERQEEGMQKGSNEVSAAVESIDAPMSTYPHTAVPLAQANGAKPSPQDAAEAPGTSTETPLHAGLEASSTEASPLQVTPFEAAASDVPGSNGQHPDDASYPHTPPGKEHSQ